MPTEREKELRLQVDLLRTNLRKACETIRRMNRGQKVHTRELLVRFGKAIGETKDVARRR